ncbi:MAG: histidine phosphatase family protein [Phycisphaerae bacterium]|nr:histidine phosphatase family protein [Phycisphaerae bacterium]
MASTTPNHRLWLFRHGATEWSRNGRHTGVTDLPLLPEGEETARRLAAVARGHDFSLVLSSPLSRARRTAELLGFHDVETDDDLHEWNYGDYEGITTAQIRESIPEWTIWDGVCPDGETGAQVTARCERVIERALAANGDVALIAHGHLLRVLAATWLGLAADAGRFFKLDTGTWCVLGFEHEYRTIERWNAPGPDGTTP